MTKSAARVLYWFRTDLRLHDSPALRAALDLQPEVLYPVFTWDPRYVYRARGASNRWQYLLDCLSDLSARITNLNKKSQLFLLREAPQTLLPKLFKAWRITHLVFEKDTDSYGRSRDEHVTKLARDAGVEVVVRSGRTLWDSDLVVKQNGGKPTMSIQQLQTAGKKVGKIDRPLPAPDSLPDPGETNIDFQQDKPDPNPDVNAPFREDEESTYNSLAGPKGTFSVPTLEEIGLVPSTLKHRGGESRGLEALDRITKNKDYTATFQKPNTAPTDFDPQSTTLLSPHMHFGSLSCREFYWRVQDIVDAYKKGASQPPASLTGQLLFRDMYFAAEAGTGPKFHQTFDNPTVRFVPWHLPSRIDAKTGLATGAYDVDSAEAEAWFQRWKHGRTGFPWIDAVMRQLRSEGWIHHLARHAVACFLTRGGCYIDWERGADVFSEHLIDHEPVCNAGNWQWLSCTAFFAQFYRCYSPIAFPQKTDKNGDYVRKYVPELAKFDKKYIYEPWKAPIADQKKWGCRVDGDGGVADGKLEEELKGEGGIALYPKPMFDFAQRRDICLAGMKEAYSVNLRGADKKVLDGTWRKEFPDNAEGPTKGSKGPPGGVSTEDDDGMGEFEEQADESPKKKHDRSESGQRGQGKLDAHVKRTKK